MGEALQTIHDAPPFAGSARFDVKGALGRGGMGVVYEVVDRDRGARLALKRLRTPHPDDILRFKTEFRALRDLQHPNLIALGELFEEAGAWFFTMELVRGRDLLAYVRGEDAAQDHGSSSGASDVLHETGSLARSTGARALAASDDSFDALGASGASSVETASRPAHAEGAARRAKAHDVAGSYDEGRLRAAFVQLALGLDALHRAGKVHRDVKPSNVLVERSGRVVILDFGVVAEHGGSGVEEEGEIVGTAAYMAPEQACGEPVGPAADWYAAGVMLYQALTGTLPFSGPAADVLTRKVTEDAPAPSTIAPTVPAALDRLCMQLLARNAADRPSAKEVLEALGIRDASTLLRGAREASAPVFVGRRDELATIRAAFERALAGRGAAVLVEGPSGIGKSATVRQAIEELGAAFPDVLVLRGRCHESETVPYNAFDGVLDDVSRWLRTSGAGLAAELPRVDALAQLFPTLRSVPDLDCGAAPGPRAELAPVELRRLAFEQLHELVTAIATQRPLIVSLDDVHWADAESLLLAESWARPKAPPALLLATARPVDGGHCAFARALSGDVRVISLAGLSDSDARAFARELATSLGDTSTLDVEGVLREAHGHPMFLRELVRFAESTKGDAPARLQLDDALLSRVDRLSPLAVRTLEAVASAGVPVREALLARVLEAPRSALATQLSVLRSARLLRAANDGRGPVLEPYHDRVREAVYNRIDPARKRALHRRIGLLLERDGASPELLVAHFDKGGAPHRAVKNALAAAKQAESALAFERAAGHYAFAIRSGLHEAAQERALRMRQGEMLQKAGRPRDAAESYLAAVATGTPGPDEAMELRRRIAEQYLMGGYLTEGTEAARAALAYVGTSTSRSALLVGLYGLFCLLRLDRIEPRWTSAAPGHVAPAELSRIDLYWSLAAGFSFLDTVRSVTFQVPGLVLAMRYGDDLRIARALVNATMNASSRGERALAKKFMAAAELAAERSGRDAARFYAKLGELSYTFMLENDCRKTLEVSREARRLWSTVGQRGGWESDVTDQYELWALAALGQIREVSERAADGVRFARATGNRFQEVMLRASFPQRYFLSDTPEEAEQDVLEAMRGWATEKGPFTTPAYWAVKSRSHLAFYAGNVEERAPALEAEWRRYDRSLLGRIALLDMESSELRCNLALRRAALALARGDVVARKRHLAHAKKFLRKLGRNPLHFAALVRVRHAAVARLLELGIASAKADLEVAIQESAREGMEAVVAGLELVLGAALGGPEGEAYVQKARRWAAAQGAVAPDRLLAVVATGVEAYRDTLARVTKS